MSGRRTADLDITIKDVRELTSADAITSFLARLGYPTGCRKNELASAYGFKPETTDTIRQLELLSEDDDDFFRVIFVQLKSITAKARNEIVRNLGKRNVDHLLILTSEFSKIEFVLIDKETKQRGSPGGGPGVQVIPRVVTVDRKSAGLVERRILRRLTWTGKDGLDQFDKIRSVFQSAHYAEQYFTNRALFADHYLVTRLREAPAWKDNPSEAYAKTKDLMLHARESWANKDEQLLRNELYDSAWKLLGFKAKVNKPAKKDHLDPDYLLKDADGKLISVAYVYRWDRWLDGPDLNDEDTPDENPGAAVVSTLAKGDVRWVIVTNGKLWRLYSKDAHSRSTNFYEVDLEEALIASDETDPNEAFRYWWLFFKAGAFADVGKAEQPKCWLDLIVEGSRDYAKRLGERLKERIFVQIFPHLAQGFLHDRKKRLGLKGKPTEDELGDVFEATLTLLYRLLFLLYAEARELLPIGETSYQAASLKRIKEEIGDKAGDSADGVPDKLKAYSESDTNIYDHLVTLFCAMDKGDSLLNVPTYNGGLFITEPDDEKDDREHRIAAFLRDHKVPDRFLALAIDRLSRDQDEKSLGLVFIDYKSLEVRHLGSIYEGLLEFKLKIADEDLATKKVKNAERYVSLSEVPTRGRKASANAVVKKGHTYLSNDKAERKATGSYYTPDPIVEYIVEHTVGPVLQEKLDALKPELDKAAKTYHRQLGNAKANKKLLKDGTDEKSFAASKTYAAHRDLVDKIFDMKVLDPSMGSGHFLVEAVDFITDKLLEFLNPYPNNPVRFMLNKTRQSILDALGTQNVAVDPDKLTDINLLKRHVLKRCIYGVDLNPMAVELAKVSLWLDAFTLGAPLSFLDHHLRCGNALIGATFDDLKRATDGQLFAVDYEPLLRAIRHVLFVNGIADATAAEVHESADQYAQARKELSGYKIVLDLLVADHFVDSKLKPSRLLQEARDLDLTTRDSLMASLDERDKRLVIQVETISRRADVCFFHWEIEFPEVFFGFADLEQREIMHKNDIDSASSGFDALVGNPPYDVLKKQRGLKVQNSAIDYFRATPQYAAGLATILNVYCLFILRGMSAVRESGSFGHIVPMALLSDASSAGIRKHLCRDTDLHTLDAFPQKDDPNNRVFSEAKLSTLVLCAKASSSTNTIRVRVHPGKKVVDNAPAMSIALARISAFDPKYHAIPLGLPQDVEIMAHLLDTENVMPAASLVTVMVGEIDMTNDRDLVASAVTPHELVKGAHIQPFHVRPKPKQGVQEWVDEDLYLAKYRGSPKESVFRSRRPILQGITGTDDSRRIKAALSRPGDFLANSVNYMIARKPGVSDWFVLAWLNCSITEWRFRLTSTNNNVNNYEVDALPIPALSDISDRSSDDDEKSAPAKCLSHFFAGKATEDAVVSWANDHSGTRSIHDQLVLLSKRISALTAGFEHARLAFREEVMRVLGAHSVAEFGKVVGKTTIDFCVPDFRSTGSALPFDAIEAVIRKNRRKFPRVPSDRCMKALESRFQGSVKERVHIRSEMARVDDAIDLTFAGAYGLSVSQINWIRDQVRSHRAPVRA